MDRLKDILNVSPPLEMVELPDGRVALSCIIPAAEATSTDIITVTEDTANLYFTLNDNYGPLPNGYQVTIAKNIAATFQLFLHWREHSWAGPGGSTPYELNLSSNNVNATPYIDVSSTYLGMTSPVVSGGMFRTNNVINDVCIPVSWLVTDGSGGYTISTAPASFVHGRLQGVKKYSVGWRRSGNTIYFAPSLADIADIKMSHHSVYIASTVPAWFWSITGAYTQAELCIRNNGGLIQYAITTGGGINDYTRMAVVWINSESEIIYIIHVNYYPWNDQEGVTSSINYQAGSEVASFNGGIKQ